MTLHYQGPQGHQAPAVDRRTTVELPENHTAWLARPERSSLASLVVKEL